MNGTVVRNNFCKIQTAVMRSGFPGGDGFSAVERIYDTPDHSRTNDKLIDNRNKMCYNYIDN